MDKKQKITDWAAESKIPGKIQAIFTAEPEACGGDWRYISREEKGRRMFAWEGIPDAPVPENLKKIEEQLNKEHLRHFKKQIFQIIFRSNGNSKYGAIIQASLRTPEQGKGYKSFLEYLQRMHPEIQCAHSVQTKPNFPFDTANPPESMQYALRKGFGSEYAQIDENLYFHILDWLPKSKGTYLKLGEKLREWLRPSSDDRLLCCHCGAAIEAMHLSKSFQDVHCLDAREWAKLSFAQNTKCSKIKNARFYQCKLDSDWVRKFFAGEANKGKWTILLNPPHGELLTSSLTQAIANAKPERIAHITGNLENAAKEANRWRSNGYALRKIMPIEWHPNIRRLELAMLFVPDRAGLLGRKKAVIKFRQKK
jgi:tRNA/tmRNA/rRNA uracil-C5-methylase (TrmA/RlmC/RlmD family)